MCGPGTRLPRRGWRWALAAAICASAGTADPAPMRKPPHGQVTVGEIRVSVRRVEWERTSTLALDRLGRPSGPASKSLEVRLELPLRSRYPGTLAAIHRGPLNTTPFAAVDNTGRVTRDTTAQVVEEEDGPLLLLSLRGLAPEATSLRSLSGHLNLFPAARLVRFNVPWLKDDLPLTTESSGGMATLRRFQLVAEDSTLWISIRPPSGLRVASFELPGTVSARALDMYGNLVNGGGITEIRQTSAGLEPEYRFTAPGMRRTPARLTLDVLCVNGSPTPKPFTLRSIALPAPH